MPSTIDTIRIRTNDADEATERLARAFGSHDRVPERFGQMGYAFFAVGTRRVMAGTTVARIGSTVHAATTGPTLHLPVQASGVYRLGRRELRARAGVAVVLAPGHEYSVRLAAGSWLALRIDPALLTEELDARAGARSKVWTVDSFELAVPTTAASAVRTTIASLSALRRAEADALPSAVAATELVVAATELAVARWFADLLSAAKGMRPASPDGARIAESVDRWIRDHLASPITLRELAQAAGVGERWLQKACIARWGRSPLELVASHRLRAARRRLLHAASGASVTRIAMECGHDHLGRFASAYKQAYGESPSDTLARGLDARRSPCGAPKALRPAAASLVSPGTQWYGERMGAAGRKPRRLAGPFVE